MNNDTMDASTAYILIGLALLFGFGCGRAMPRAPAAPPAPPDRDALEAVRPILEREGKIAAIKAYRERTGVGLRDAKDAVESLG
jgi:ribosomal protein L7/L12